MAIKKEILDELLKDRDPKTMFSSDGLLSELKKAFAERVLNAEMDLRQYRLLAVAVAMITGLS